MLKKLLATAATLLLGAGLSVAAVSPAVAAEPSVTGTAVCNPVLGTYDITWHVEGSPEYADATATIISARQSGVEVTTTPALVGVTASGTSFTDGVQQNVGPGYYRLDVKVSWSDGEDSGVFGVSGAVTASAEGCVGTDPQPPVTSDPAVVYEVGAYLYKKIDPSKNASGGNSGPQTFLEARAGTDWFEPTVQLPDYVCGPGWAVQEDAVAYTAGSFQWPAMLDLQHGITIGEPLYDSMHADLEDLVDVPDCDIDTLPAWDALASVNQPLCTPTGVLPGSITVLFPADDPDAVRYFIDRNLATEQELTETTTQLPAGTYSVTAEARQSGSTVLPPTQWTLAIGEAPTTCDDFPTLAAWDALASVSQPVCAATGIVPGSITVLFPADDPDAVRYFIDRNLATERELTATTTQLPTGTYSVTAEPRDPQHTVLAPSSWTLAIGTAPTVCVDLNTLPFETPTLPVDLGTLALTGVAASGALTLAGGLLAAGIVAVLAARRRWSTQS